MTHEHAFLFSPVTIKNVELPNRIALAPMGNHLQGPAGEMTEAMLMYLEERARGGTGLIITPFASVSPNHPTFGAYSDDLLDGLRQLADRIHAHGAKTFLQINDLGAINPCNRIASTARASPLYLGGVIPRALSRDQIPGMIERYVAAAERASKAGFDGIELHGGYSYLVASFYSSHLNGRTDDYGGSFENRMRFVDDIIHGIETRVGSDFAIGFKLNGHEHAQGGIDTAQAVRIARHLQARGIAYFHVVSSFPFDGTDVCEYSGLPTMYDQRYGMILLAEEIKQHVSVPVIAAGGIVDPDDAEDVIRRGRADMVAIGRGLIADPMWPEKVRNGGTVRFCIKCNKCHIFEVFNGEPVRCTVNPRAGREQEAAASRVPVARRISVIGGGPAGMEAALTGARRGHEVTLYEARDVLGGKVGLASQLPFKLPVRTFVDHLAEEVRNEPGITVRLGTKLEPDDLRSLEADEIVCAVGAKSVVPEIPGMAAALDDGRALTVVQALDQLRIDGTFPGGERYVILGAGLAGCEVAWYLATLGRQVLVFEMVGEPEALADEHSLNRAVLLNALSELGVSMRFHRRLRRVDDGRARFTSEAGFEEEVPFDRLLIATGYAASTELCNAMRQAAAAPVHTIGDCGGEFGCFTAMHQGYDLARTL